MSISNKIFTYRLDGLRQKLESHGMRDVVYMVINHQEEQSQRLHPMLAQRLSDKISLYKQAEQQPDVWQTLNAKKDDFIIYDRFVRLFRHILEDSGVTQIYPIPG